MARSDRAFSDFESDETAFPTETCASGGSAEDLTEQNLAKRVKDALSGLDFNHGVFDADGFTRLFQLEIATGGGTDTALAIANDPDALTIDSVIDIEGPVINIDSLKSLPAEILIRSNPDGSTTPKQIGDGYLCVGDIIDISIRISPEQITAIKAELALRGDIIFRLQCRKNERDFTVLGIDFGRSFV